MAQQPDSLVNPLAELGVSSATNSAAETTPLNTSPYDFTGLKYPEDLGDFSSRNAHYVNFFINVHRGSNYFASDTTFGSVGGYSYEGAPSAYTSTDIAPGSFAGGTNEGVFTGTKQELTYTRINQAISLYIPDSMSLSQGIEWGETSVAAFGASLLQGGADLVSGGARSAADAMAKNARKNTQKTTSSKMAAAAGLAGAANEVLNAGGFAMNPQLLVLFRGIGFRSFQYDFVFTPRNEKEAESVRNIIRAFRFHAHPELNNDYGVFYIAPSTFDIEFMHKRPLDFPDPITGISGTRNTNVHRVKSCVLTNYSVDYAPFGWSTFKDGMPVQTKLSLQFMETEIITKKQIEEGF